MGFDHSPKLMEADSQAKVWVERFRQRGMATGCLELDYLVGPFIITFAMEGFFRLNTS